MKAFKVYLAGPIAGLAFDEAQDWRDYATDALAPHIECYSPLRQKAFLRSGGFIGHSRYSEPLASDRGIMTRDHYDCQTANAILVNLIGATAVSKGTVMEMAWAYAYRKPLVVAMEEGNIHDHPMLREAADYSVGSLDEAIDITRAILLSSVR